MDVKKMKKEFKRDYWQMVADEAIKQKKPEILQDAMEHIEVSDGFRAMAAKWRAQDKIGGLKKQIIWNLTLKHFRRKGRS